MSDRDRTNDGDPDLRDDFQSLRSEVKASGRVPDFDAMIARAKEESASRPALEVVAGGAAGGPSRESAAGTGEERTRRRAVKIGGWMSLATAAAAAAVLLVSGPVTDSDADAEFERLVASYSTDASAGAWRSPTATLLRTPGVDLGSVPSIGTPLRGLDPVPLPESDAPQGRDL